MTGTASTTKCLSPVAIKISLTGRVQGIGMRPTVARLAQQLGLAGFVGNTLDGVEIHVEGTARSVERFEDELSSHVSVLAEISACQSIRADPEGFDSFLIAEAGTRSTMRGSSPVLRLSARVPSDVAVCDQCLAEVRDVENRRRAYPFTSCTNCGPRYSILETMPYEREQTSMVHFPLCSRCRLEYESPSERRFHAQTNACPNCGPRVWLRDGRDRVVARGADAISAAARAILNGRIVALRGLGGYQLLVDATSDHSVGRLRRRKHRPGKPLAVMVESLFEAEKLATLNTRERRVLTAPEGPIVVASVRPGSGIPSTVTGGLATIGLMLPTTPMHALLLDAVKRPLVCTSANVEGNPLVVQAAAAFEELKDIADVWLEHDRSIRRAIDDSVVRVVAGRAVSIRLGRGFAPLHLSLEADQPLLALGGHQKASIAMSNGEQAVLGPHVGDLDAIATRERYVEQMSDMLMLYGIEGSEFACDLHPDYFTSVWTEGRSACITRVQHHHAHVVAGMLEHGWLDRQVVGVAFDGTGFGTDGAIWGGEFLLATEHDFQRVGHLRPFPMLGGEIAIRQPWRIATALVCDAAGPEEAAKLTFHDADAKSLLPVLQRPGLASVTTSAGRLFDGVASLVLGTEVCLFAGQAAMLLESACHLSEQGQYDISITEGQPAQLDWRPLVRQILYDRIRREFPGVMAMRFHRGLASAIVRFCRRYSSMPIVFGGGVFQNKVLLELLVERLAETAQRFGLPGLIPPNDGGLAAGQLAVSAALARGKRA